MRPACSRWAFCSGLGGWARRALDEWQIGILGITAGIAFALGGGRYSADRLRERRFPSTWGRLSLLDASPHLPKIALGAVAATFALALFTNQVFHGGVWGSLHNKSVRPKVEISDAHVAPEGLRFSVSRMEGADGYGSFLIGVRVLDALGTERARWTGEELAKIPTADISNRYVGRIKPGAHSLVLPLGAKATVLLRTSALSGLLAGLFY